MSWPYVYAGRYSPHRRRRHGRPAQNVSAHRFVAYLQNHDQLGNRAQGDRVCHLVSEDRAKIGAALVLLSPFVPMLFQGEEWGATAPFQYFVDFGSEPELAEAVARGRQSEFASFGWRPEEVPNPNDAATFQRSKLDWREVDQPDHRDLLQWHRDLIQLRRCVSAFTTGRLDDIATRYNEDDKWLIVERGPVSIACNFAPTQQSIPLNNGRNHHLLLASKPADVSGTTVALPAESVAIFGPSNDC